MKTRLIFPLVLFLSLCLPWSCYINIPEGITGNGNVTTEEREVPEFHGLKVSSGIDVFITQNSDVELSLEADENLHDVIKTEVEGGILKIYADKNIRMAKSKKVYLTYKSLDKIHISSAGDVKGQNLLTGDDLDISLSSAGNLNLEVQVNRLKINISSSGDARLSGSTDELDADLSSAGDLYAFDLIAKKGRVTVSSAGDARVNITEDADLRSSSAGDIEYMGNPERINIHTSSAGSIRKK